MLIPITTKQFEKDVKKAKKQGKEIRKLKQVIKYLIDEVHLPPQNKDHKLTGNISSLCLIELLLNRKKWEVSPA